MIKQGKLAGCLVKFGKYNKIDRDLADAALAHNLDRIYNPSPKSQQRMKNVTPPETNTMSLADAQKVQAQYKAALLKLEFDEKSGKLIPAEDVKTTAFDLGRRVRDYLLNIPNRISAELATKTDVHDINEKLTLEITQALEELSI